MSFNTAALYGCHQPIPSSNQTRCEPLPPRRPRASTMTQDANTRWHPDAQQIPGLHATDDNSPPFISNREYSVMRDDVGVQNDRIIAAIEQESIEMKRAMHEFIERERRGHVSLDQPQEHPSLIDYERVRHACVDRKRQHCEPVDRERELRASTDWRHDRKRDMSIGRHGQYGSGSRTPPRPPVCADSSKPLPPIPQFPHCLSESESMAFPRPPVCAPTTCPQFGHPRRFSFDHSGEHQHPLYDLPPNAPVPQIHMPTRRRAASVKAVRRLRFHKPKAPQLGKSNPLG
ncbi:hypothetical protein EDD22DRAFT_532966 [Suillus occidentalis]|nr:hypothetical protein EDD22DRAFT_532966 [Suillus occidentalis]